MDGENNGKPYERMDDLGIPLFLETPIYIYSMLFLLGISKKGTQPHGFQVNPATLKKLGLCCSSKKMYHEFVPKKIGKKKNPTQSPLKPPSRV